MSSNLLETAPVSVWLYIAGLIVTLSGLYSVNFGSSDDSFAVTTYGLAILGYIVSFVLRTRHVSLKSVQLPFFVITGLVVMTMMSSERELGWLAPMGMEDDGKWKILQLIFAWMSILQSFMLLTDAMVLFSCVPTMTMLALVSTRNTDPQLQNAFVVFISAATFMMVHENYLRTRAALIKDRSPIKERRLFGGQLQLTAVCLIGSLILANIVAVPIRTLGQTLFGNTPMGQMTSQIPKPPIAQTILNVGERSQIELGSGPQTENDAIVMRVRCDRGLYWRGSTFAKYTGRTFVNTDATTETVVNPEHSDTNGLYSPQTFSSSDEATQPQRFKVPVSRYELPAADMKGSKPARQQFSVTGGMLTQLYAAANVNEVVAKIPSLHQDSLGNLKVGSGSQLNAQYEVESMVASDDPQILRAASSSRSELPEPIQSLYLQTLPESSEASNRLRELAAQITHGISNNYDKVIAIKDYIARTCQYNLQTPHVPDDKDVVAYFLLDSHQGYCDSFGAALTMLCRYAGIPARLASGYLSGELSGDNDYIVKEKHKHLWTEVFFPHVGWASFDATENATDITVRKSTPQRRSMNFLAWVRSNGVLPPLILISVMAIILYLIKTEIVSRVAVSRKQDQRLERPQTNLQIMSLYGAACDLLRRRGLGRRSDLTADEYARHIAGLTQNVEPGIVREIQVLTDLYTVYRYGIDVATEADVLRAKNALANLKQALATTGRRTLADVRTKAIGESGAWS